ncbi:MAG: uracil-DNA glycosylase [Methylacidiphilales bacterium]|nr:uracil-DNA glycosylase [Candidatus Methylacidiphilales bacterium]
MNESLEPLRHYVQFLRERQGVREIKLSRAARQGLARLAAAVKAAPTAVMPTSTARQTAVSAAPISRSPVSSTAAKSPVTAAPVAPAKAEPVMEISGANKVEQLKHLSERAAVCMKCPHLAARRHTVVFGVGTPDAQLMFVGEGPGEDEDLKGEPFVGRAGQLLTKMIAAMGLTREQVYIGNVLKCRPDMPPGASGNRKPTREEMETCLPYLRAQIDIIKPKVIVGLGATALEGLLGKVSPISRLRGSFLDYRGIPLMPTFHPSYLLRNQSNTEKRKVWEDLLQVMERLEMPISEKQRGYFLAK